MEERLTLEKLGLVNEEDLSIWRGKLLSMIDAENSDSGCWIWLGNVHQSGLAGNFVLNGTNLNARTAAVLLFGDEKLRSSKKIRSCEYSQLCFNPEHLRPLSDLRARLEASSEIRPGPLGTPCRIWTGALHEKGYGAMKVDGVNTRPHIVAWELENEPVPAGMLLRHKCDVRACIEVKHLELGTAKQNTQDMFERGRSHWQKFERGTLVGKKVSGDGSESLLDRILHQCTETTGPMSTPCLIWTGNTNREAGYGRMCINGKTHNVAKIAWEEFYGESLPPGSWVRHRCKNKACIRQDHLYIE